MVLPPVCGDYNGDRKLTSLDALGALKAAVGVVPCILEVCDFNGDNKVSSVDALAILRAAVGIPSTPKCPAGV